MFSFNKNSRMSNVVKTSTISVACNIINLLISFLYRTVFLSILSTEYLGMQGLFTNILQVLSLAELGITSAIVYRFYEPISKNNIEKVGQIMNFIRQIYRIIAITIMGVGIILIPFLKYLIKDVNEVPSDVNIYIVYFLYLLQTVSSYICAYKQTILTADQRQYMLSAFHTLINFMKNLFQIGILVVYRNYELSLLIGVATNIGLNILVSFYVNKLYRPIFEIKSSLGNEKKEVYSDTLSTMCHKIGGVILNGTDSIVISKFIGLASTGLYSNYALIVNSLNTLMSYLLGSFTSTLGNARIEQEKSKKIETYHKLLFINLWVAGIISSCFFLLVNDFIAIWLDENMQLNSSFILVITIQLYFEMTRKITSSYTNASGLFVKDRMRPIVESIINLIISVILVQIVGLTGVIIGTIISHCCTVLWREPLILYKYEFNISIKEYWNRYIKFILTTILATAVEIWVVSFMNYKNFGLSMFFLKCVVCFALYNLITILIYCRSKEFIELKRTISLQIKNIID